MGNALSSFIPKVSYEEIFHSSFSFGPYGFIFSKVFDSTICFPSSISSLKMKGHDDSIRITFKLLYPSYLDLFHKNREIIKQKTPVQACFVDKDEMIYAIFLASIGEVCFLDSTEGAFTSGLLFLPSDLSSLSSSQLKATHLFLDVMKEKIEKEKITPVYQALLISDASRPEKDCTFMEMEEIRERIGTLYREKDSFHI